MNVIAQDIMYMFYSQKSPNVWHIHECDACIACIDGGAANA